MPPQNQQQIMMALVRSEAKAQAKIQAAQVAEQFNIIHASDKATIDALARSVNTLGVMVEVLIGLVIDPRPLQTEGLPADKRKKFSALCDARAAEFAKERGLEVEVRG